MKSIAVFQQNPTAISLYIHTPPQRHVVFFPGNIAGLKKVDLKNRDNGCLDLRKKSSFLQGKTEMSNEKKGLPWLFRVFFGDEILPSYMGIIINHSKDSY